MIVFDRQDSLSYVSYHVNLDGNPSWRRTLGRLEAILHIYMPKRRMVF
jgi:hypothetical protein